jgi:nucleoside-diphosphate-sugar epimerase
MRILVIGGTQFIGRRLVQRLLEAGHEVTLLHRKRESPFSARVTNVVADRNDAASIRGALAGRRFDAAYDIAYDPEHGTTAEQVEATAVVVPGDLTRYVFMSSVAAYGDGLDHDEDDALAPPAHPNPYVRNKAESERALFRLNRESGLPAVTLRPPFVYGPWNPLYREAFFWDRIRAGRPVIVPGDGTRLMQFVYVEDLVAACFAALESPNAPGRAFNIGNPAPITQVAAVRAFAAACGRPVDIVHVPRDVIERNSGNIFTEPFYFGQYLDIPPITERVARVQRELGVEITSFSAGLAETFEWYAAQAPHREADFTLEDRLIREASA